MVLSDEQLKEIMDRLLKSINEGLSKESHDTAAVKCFVTYVQDLPNGKGKCPIDNFQFNVVVEAKFTTSLRIKSVTAANVNESTGRNYK